MATATKETAYNMRLRQNRERMGYLQVEVADKLGISVSAVKMHEQGHRVPSLKTMRAYAELFDRTLDDLFG